MNGKDVIKKLQQEEWKILRICGSHYRMGKGCLRTTIPVHGNRDLGKGLLRAIERQSGVLLK